MDGYLVFLLTVFRFLVEHLKINLKGSKLR